MTYRKIPLGRYLKVAYNPYMTFEELFDIMYTKDVGNALNSWVQITLDKIHKRDMYIVHSPIDGCYSNIYVEDYSSDKYMEEEMKVKPLAFLGTL